MRTPARSWPLQADQGQVVPVLRPSGQVTHGSLRAHEPAGEPQLLQPSFGSRAADDGGGTGDVGVQTGPGRDAHGAPRAPGRPARPWVDEVMRRTPLRG